MPKRNYKCPVCSPNGGAIAEKMYHFDTTVWRCRNCNAEKPILRRRSEKRDKIKAFAEAMISEMALEGERR